MKWTYLTYYYINSINGKKTSCVNTMNGKQGIESIGKLFADNYKELYNSVSYNCSEMNSINTYINDKIISDCDTNVCNVSHNIDVTDVQNAVQFLKHNKSDGTNELYSDAIINGGDVLYNHLSMLFSACITHGITPNNMLSGTLIPIPKNAKKSLSDCSNYRAIALGNLLCKLLDIIVMSKNYHVFSSSALQFGFKKQHSTTQCTFVMEEVVEFYNAHKSPVFIVALDASKAFDKVEYCKLFNLLLARNICPLYARLLLYLYTQQI